MSRLGAVCGLLAPLTFTLAWLLGGLAQPAAYDWVDHTISDLGAQSADRPWLYNQMGANLTGLLLLVLAAGLWPVLGGRSSGRVGVVALGVFGLGEFLDGWFRLDCRQIDPGCVGSDYSTLARAHLVESVVTILAMVVATFALARAFRATEGWQDLWVLTLVVAVFTVLSLLALGPWIGLAERVAFTVWLAWVALVSWRLLRLAPS